MTHPPPPPPRILPKHPYIHTTGEVQKVYSALMTYALAASTVMLYWFKIRRLLLFTDVLHLLQQFLLCIWLFAIVLVPKFVGLVIDNSGSSGTVHHWTSSQTINCLMLTTYFITDLSCLLFALFLRSCDYLLLRRQSLVKLIHTQVVIFLLMCSLIITELFSIKFNGECIYIVPVVLLMEEFWVSFGGHINLGYLHVPHLHH